MNTKSIEMFEDTMSLQGIQEVLRRKKAFVEKVVNEFIKYNTGKEMAENPNEYSQNEEKPVGLRKTYPTTPK